MFPNIFSLEKINGEILLTLLSLFFILLIRYLIIKKIQNAKKMDVDSKRLLTINTSTYAFILLAIFFLLIWSEELKILGISLMTVSVAIVLAGKELILCIIASVYKSISRISKIGDRIEIHGLRGDVIFSGLLSTTILEIGPNQKSHQYTGRSITIPNSYFLQHRTVNESFLKDYVLHIFVIPIAITSKIEEAKKLLEEITGKFCSPFLADARKHLNHLQYKKNIQTPDPESRVYTTFKDENTLEFIVRVTVPSKQKGMIERNSGVCCS